MLKLNEELLQFIWKHKLLKPSPLISSLGSKIELLKTGELNSDAGPDFFNGQIRLNGTVLAGNIEIHVKTSDWLKHKHQENKNYDNIILHVVYEHDTELPQNKNNNVEVLELKSLIAETTLENYAHLCSTKDKIPCASQLKQVNDLKWTNWLERMSIERLEEKVKRINDLFLSFNGDYTQTFYTLLLRNFGFKVNALPFELLAKQLPVTILLKHSDNLMQLEALVFGVSGLLENQFEDKYIRSLQNEFEYLKTKYHLKSLDKGIFKFSKMRPANFPSLRLAQVAELIHLNPGLFTSPHENKNYAELKKALEIKPRGYWKDHYKMDGKKQDHVLNFGESSAQNVIINTFAPFFFFYSKKTGKAEYGEIAVRLLEQCDFEVNTKTKLFEPKKHLLKTGADSQGLINLCDNYCRNKACLKCAISTAILKP